MGASTDQSVCSDRTMGALPERWKLGQADGLDVDVSLSVEASPGVLQLDGVDLTQSSRVSQHRLVHRRICLTATHAHAVCM